LTEANLHDLRQLLTLLLIEFPRVGGLPGRPLERPLSVTTDKGYDCQATRDLLRTLGIEPIIPRRGTCEDQPLGSLRWPVERTISWLKQFRRLRIRWDRLEDIHQAFLNMACSLIIWRKLIAE
jgi:transposase